jgi:hypothetical protein
MRVSELLHELEGVKDAEGSETTQKSLPED